MERLCYGDISVTSNLKRKRRVMGRGYIHVYGNINASTAELSLFFSIDNDLAAEVFEHEGLTFI